MVEIWVLSLFFIFFVGTAALTKFSIAPPLAKNTLQTIDQHKQNMVQKMTMVCNFMIYAK
jgi:hypothetical protein